MNKTIGCFVSPYRHEYLLSVVDGVRAACEAEGYSLVLISATLQDYFYGVRRESVVASFACAAASQLDAYIVIYGILRQFADIGGDDFDIERECLRLLPRDRTLVIEEDIPGYHCLTKDNIPGMREVMRHLIDECGCRRIGMISGPEVSRGARERESVYFDEMARHGYAVEEGWFARAENSGRNRAAADEFVAANQDLDAVVCATDAIALNVYDALEKVGLKPGVDMAVTGYDDAPSASTAIPPLTTVNLDPFEFGYNAGRQTARLLRGEPQMTTSMRGHLVVRGSCGEDLTSNQSVYQELVRRDPFPADDITWIILNECTKTIVAHEKHAYHDAVLRLVNAAYEVYRHEALDGAEFDKAAEMDELRMFSRGEELGEFRLERFQLAFNEYLYALEATAGPVCRDAIVRLIVHVNLTLTRYVDLEGISQAHKHAEFNLSLSKIIQGTLSTNDMDAALESIINGIAQTGMRNAFIVLLDEPVSFSGSIQQPLPHDMCVVAAVVDGKPVTYGDDGPRVSADEIPGLASYIDGSRVFSTIGLYENHELLGFFLAETDSTEFSSVYFASLQITYALRHVQIIQDELEMISMLDQSNVQLLLDSQTDALSGLLNRRGFIERAYGRIAASSTPYGAIFYLDLDRFKDINDRFGHDVGDDAICSLADILRRSLRSDDLIARAGGDEFIFFVDISDEKEVNVIRDRIENNISRFNATKEKPYRLRASIGYHVFETDGSVDLEDALKCADQMQYQVKKAHHAIYGDRR